MKKTGGARGWASPRTEKNKRQGEHGTTPRRQSFARPASAAAGQTAAREPGIKTRAHSTKTPRAPHLPLPPPLLSSHDDNNPQRTHTSVRSAARTASAAAGTPPRRRPASRSSRTPHAPMRAPSAARRPVVSAMAGSSTGGGGRPAPPWRPPPPVADATRGGDRGGARVPIAIGRGIWVRAGRWMHWRVAPPVLVCPYLKTSLFCSWF